MRRLGRVLEKARPAADEFGAEHYAQTVELARLEQSITELARLAGER